MRLMMQSQQDFQQASQPPTPPLTIATLAGSGKSSTDSPAEKEARCSGRGLSSQGCEQPRARPMVLQAHSFKGSAQLHRWRFSCQPTAPAIQCEVAEKLGQSRRRASIGGGSDGRGEKIAELERSHPRMRQWACSAQRGGERWLHEEQGHYEWCEGEQQWKREDAPIHPSKDVKIEVRMRLSRKGQHIYSWEEMKGKSFAKKGRSKFRRAVKTFRKAEAEGPNSVWRGLFSTPHQSGGPSSWAENKR